MPRRSDVSTLFTHSCASADGGPGPGLSWPAFYKRKTRATVSLVIFGHLGASGGLEAGILALVLDQQILPPTINLDHPGEGCDLDFVPNSARKSKVENGLTNSFGFGGTNGALIFRRWTE